MKTVTLDTGVLIVLIDSNKDSTDVETIFQWHQDKKIELYVSNRVFEHDTKRMNSVQVEMLRNRLSEYCVLIKGAVFRSSFSNLSGGDLLSGGKSVRTTDDMNRFKSIVGCDPVELPQSCIGNKLSNKLGDYDSLCEHYASGRNVFLTLDTNDYLSVNKREIYINEIGLSIMSPSEFVVFQ